MDWNKMRKQWQEAPGAAPERDLMAGIRQRDESLRSTIRQRDLLESAVALLMAPVLAFMAWRAGSAGQWPSAFFSAFLGLWAAYVPLHLWRNRRALPQPRPQQPLIEYLRLSHAAMVLQARQLEQAWTWYLMPCAIGVLGMSFAARGSTLAAWIYAAVVIAFFVFLGIVNKRAAKTRFRDHAADIERQIEFLTKESTQ